MPCVSIDGIYLDKHITMKQELKRVTNFFCWFYSLYLTIKSNQTNVLVLSFLIGIDILFLNEHRLKSEINQNFTSSISRWGLMFNITHNGGPFQFSIGRNNLLHLFPYKMLPTLLCPFIILTILCISNLFVIHVNARLWFLLTLNPKCHYFNVHCL